MSPSPITPPSQAPTLTTHILTQVEKLRQDRSSRHAHLSARIDAELARRALRSREVAAMLEDAKQGRELGSVGVVGDAGYMPGSKDRSGRGGAKADEDGEVEPNDSQSTIPYDDAVDSSLKDETGEAVDGMIKDSMNPVALSKELAEVEASIRLITKRRIALRDTYLRDLHDLDTLESRLTHISSRYEDGQRRRLVAPTPPSPCSPSTSASSTGVIERWFCASPRGVKRGRDAVEEDVNSITLTSSKEAALGGKHGGNKRRRMVGDGVGGVVGKVAGVMGVGMVAAAGLFYTLGGL
ncbi:hypothetical protein HK101_008103 [Irineochytrium annulatum]|nr:hypothetical protein HK101_008103 [Irineochytrium annulatum]